MPKIRLKYLKIVISIRQDQEGLATNTVSLFIPLKKRLDVDVVGRKQNNRRNPFSTNNGCKFESFASWNNARRIYQLLLTVFFHSATICG